MDDSAPPWLVGSLATWAYFDDRQNHLRDVVGRILRLTWVCYPTIMTGSWSGVLGVLSGIPHLPTQNGQAVSLRPASWAAR